jgi:sugar/nucleoside kinase (ribokinase family)
VGIPFLQVGEDVNYNIANSASAQLSVANLRDDLLANCGNFHVMGSSLFSFRIIEAIKQAIETVKTNGGTVSFDPNIRKEMLQIPEMRDALDFVLDYTDVFLPSGHEVTLLTSATSERGAIDELLKRGVKEVIVKRGAQGCSFFDADGEMHRSAFKVQELDPTGAGDCFGATYMSCRAQGRDVNTALKYACASGARAVGVKGPMEGTATFAELDAFLRSATE